MAGVPGILLLLVAFYGFAFGVTRLLLRGSCWEPYSLEAPWLTGPALLVLMLSAGGYLEPIHLFAWQAWLVLALGWTISAVVVAWQWRELLLLLRARWLCGLTIGVPALVGGAVLVGFFPGNQWDDVCVPFVWEYVQYAELSASMTGQHQGQPDMPATTFCARHRQIRIGQDLIIATVAEVTGRHPIQVIVPLAVLFRLQQTIVLGLVLCGMIRGKKQLLAVFVVLLLEALVGFEVLSFGSSFFSANCTMPLYALYLIWLACQEEFGLREGVILVLMNLFFLVTYPELLPIAKAFELLAMGIALWRGQGRRWVPLMLCNVALILTHPLLILAKCQFAGHELAHSEQTGWDVMGHPIIAPFQFLGTLLGLRYGYLPGDPLYSRGPLGPVLSLVVLAQMGLGLVMLARKYRVGLPLLAWSALLVAIHVRCVMLDNYYSAFKILALSYFLLLLGAAAVLLAARPRWRVVGGVVVVVWLTAAAHCTKKMTLTFNSASYTVSYAQLRDTVLRCSGGRPLTALTLHREPFGLLNLISGETGQPLVAVKPEQERVVREHALGQVRDGTLGDPDGTLFQGLVLVDAGVLRTGQVDQKGTRIYFECTKVLAHIGSLHLCEGRVFVPASSPLRTSYSIPSDDHPLRMRLWGAGSGPRKHAVDNQSMAPSA
jgi:hypothetical protein